MRRGGRGVHLVGEGRGKRGEGYGGEKGRVVGQVGRRKKSSGHDVSGCLFICVPCKKNLQMTNLIAEFGEDRNMMAIIKPIPNL